MKNTAIINYRHAVELYYMNHTADNARLVDEKAWNLVRHYGLTWDETDAIEFAVYAELEGGK